MFISSLIVLTENNFQNHKNFVLRKPELGNKTNLIKHLSHCVHTSL